MGAPYFRVEHHDPIVEVSKDQPLLRRDVPAELEFSAHTRSLLEATGFLQAWVAQQKGAELPRLI